MTSLVSSANGLDTAQTGLDIIANNVANVNTVGYRSTQTHFADLLYNASKVATSTNPVDIATGSGSRVAGTVSQFTQGSLQSTGVASDVSISGDGFFALADSSSEAPTTYSRAGNFVVDSSGYLRSQAGLYVNGVGNFGTVAGASNYLAPTGAINNLSAVRIPQTLSDGSPSTSYSINGQGAITVNGSQGESVVVGYLPLATFRSNTGLSQQAGTNFAETPASGPATYYAPGQGTAGATQGGSVESSNVNLSAEFSNLIITQQAFNACAKGVTVSNEVLQTAIGLKR